MAAQRASPTHDAVDEMPRSRPAPLQPCPAASGSRRVAQHEHHPPGEQEYSRRPRHGRERRGNDDQQAAKCKLADTEDAGADDGHGRHLALVC